MNILLRLYPGDHTAWLIGNVVAQVTIVLLLAWLLARAVTHRSAAARHGVWLCALVCVLLSPVIAYTWDRMGLSTLRVPVSRTPTADSAPLTTALVSEPTRPAGQTPWDPTAPASSDAVAMPSPPPSLPRATPVSPADRLRTAGGAVVVIWVGGVLFLLGRLLHGWRRLARLRRGMVPVEGRAIDRACHDVRAALGVAALPPIVTSPGADSPLAAGVFRPVVILPETVLQTLRGPQLRDVLVHECAHVVRRDPLVGLLQRVAEMLFWPHPLVHVMNHELARAREEVCDNHVLAKGDGRCYAQTLLELSEMLAPLKASTSALSLFPPRWGLEERVAGLLDTRRKTMTQSNRFAAAGVAVTLSASVALIGGTRLLRAEPAGSEPQAGAAATTLAVASAQASVGASESKAAIAAIEKLNGTVEVDETRPGRPVVKVDLSSTGVTDADLVHLKGLPKLWTLRLGGTSITDAGLVHLEGLTQLQTLHLSHTEVSDAGLVHLKGLNNLGSLWLEGNTRITGAGLVHLKGLPKLKSLWLGGTSITDAGLVHLRGGWVNLQLLYINKNPISGAGLVHLKGLPKLWYLDLRDTNVSDAGLVHLKGLDNLQALDLHNTEVTDAGLLHLQGLPELRRLQLSGLTLANLTEGSFEDVLAIRKARAAYETALNRRDAQAIASFYAPATTFRRTNGWTSLHFSSHRAGWYVGRWRRQHRLSVDFINFVKPDAALLGGTWEERRSPAQAWKKNRHTTIYIKRNGKWLIESTQMWGPLARTEQ